MLRFTLPVWRGDGWNIVTATVDKKSAHKFCTYAKRECERMSEIARTEPEKAESLTRGGYLWMDAAREAVRNFAQHDKSTQNTVDHTASVVATIEERAAR